MTERLTALKYCANNEFEFASIFRSQFLFSLQPKLETPGWTNKKLGAWVLHHCPDLSCIEIRDSDETLVGFVLGVAVDGAGELVAKTVSLSVSATDPKFWDIVENYIVGLAGRYAVSVLDGDTPRIYTDPVADYGVVYDAQARLAGSTLTLVSQRPLEENFVFPWRTIRRFEMRYSLGHTRDAHIKRLYANHYLDLSDFSTNRFWPRADTDLTTRNEAECDAIVDAIQERLSKIMGALLSMGNCILPLSGGRDSRCLLGTGMDKVDQAEFIYSWQFHRQSSRDAGTAAEICKRLNLEHKIFKSERLTHRDKQKFFLANGYATFGDELRTLAIHKQIQEKVVILRGNIMGILRATNWRGQSEGSLNLKHGVKRLRIGVIPDQAARASFERDFLQWYDTLPEQGKNKVHDLAWLDITLPHQQGARWYGFPQHFYMNPYCDRELLALSMQLPLDLRRNDQAYAALLDRTVPHLKDIPYI